MTLPFSPEDSSYREVEIVDQIIPVINQNERDFEDSSDVEDVAQEYAF